MDFAFALGFPSADHFLRTISTSQWLEWLEWTSVRGPIGPARDDIYAALMAKLIGQLYPPGANVWLTDFMPWVRSDPGTERDPEPDDGD